jgi:hypothetical protein
MALSAIFFFRRQMSQHSLIIERASHENEDEDDEDVDDEDEDEEDEDEEDEDEEDEDDEDEDEEDVDDEDEYEKKQRKKRKERRAQRKRFEEGRQEAEKRLKRLVVKYRPRYTDRGTSGLDLIRKIFRELASSVRGCGASYDRVDPVPVLAKVWKEDYGLLFLLEFIVIGLRRPNHFLSIDALGLDWMELARVTGEDDMRTLENSKLGPATCRLSCLGIKMFMGYYLPRAYDKENTCVNRMCRIFHFVLCKTYVDHFPAIVFAEVHMLQRLVYMDAVRCRVCCGSRALLAAEKCYPWYSKQVLKELRWSRYGLGFEKGTNEYLRDKVPINPLPHVSQFTSILIKAIERDRRCWQTLQDRIRYGFLVPRCLEKIFTKHYSYFKQAKSRFCTLGVNVKRDVTGVMTMFTASQPSMFSTFFNLEATVIYDFLRTLDGLYETMGAYHYQTGCKHGLVSDLNSRLETWAVMYPDNYTVSYTRSYVKKMYVKNIPREFLEYACGEQEPCISSHFVRWLTDPDFVNIDRGDDSSLAATFEIYCQLRELIVTRLALMPNCTDKVEMLIDKLDTALHRVYDQLSKNR